MKRKKYWFSKYIPTHQSVKDNPYLSFMGSKLHNPALWHWNRKRVATGMALGVFFGFLVPVAQMPISVLAAVALRANIPMALASTFIANPVTFAPVYYGAYSFGGWILGESGSKSEKALDTGLYGASVKGQSVALGQWQEYLLNQTGAGYIYKSVGQVGSVGVKGLNSLQGLVFSVLPKASHATAIAPMSGGVTGVNEIIHSQASLNLQSVLFNASKSYEVSVPIVQTHERMLNSTSSFGGKENEKKQVNNGNVSDGQYETQTATIQTGSVEVSEDIAKTVSALEQMSVNERLHALEKINQKDLPYMSVTQLETLNVSGLKESKKTSDGLENESEERVLGGDWWNGSIGQMWDQAITYVTGVGKALVVGLVSFAFIFGVLVYIIVHGLWIWHVQSKRKNRINSYRKGASVDSK